MTDAPPGWSLILEFPDQSASFCRGFEAGQLYHRMKIELGPIYQTIGVSNQEMIIRMCASLGWAAEFTKLGDDWIEAVLSRSQKPHLSVVQK